MIAAGTKIVRLAVSVNGRNCDEGEEEVGDWHENESKTESQNAATGL